MVWGRKRSNTVQVESKKEEEKKEEVSEDSEKVEDEGSGDDDTIQRKFVLTNIRTDIKRKNCISCATSIPESALRCYHCHYDQPIDLLDVSEPIQVEKNTRFYKIYKISIRSDNEDKSSEFNGYSRMVLKIKDKNLINYLSSWGIRVNVVKQSKKKKKYRAWATGRDLVMALGQLRTAQVPAQGWKELIEDVEQIKKRMISEIETLIKNKKIIHDGLWYIFEVGAPIFAFKKDGLKQGALIKSSNYMPGFSGDAFNIVGSVVRTNGKFFYRQDETFTVNQFAGVRDLDQLTVQPLNKSTMKELMDRGKLYKKLAIDHHYMQYTGAMLKSYGFFSTKTKADGRVMIDVETNNRRNPSGCSEYTYNGSHAVTPENDPNVMMKLHKDECWMTGAILPGFSFALKQWGEFIIDNVSEIRFDDEAFARLVLPKEKKFLIHALVEDYRKNIQMMNQRKKGDELPSQLFTDIISGKGGGCIFLLHGSPGVGKTLTAEAVSEHLHIPLYMVTVGELGTTPDSLEKNLQNILELAAIWGAAILLDEADIFLEKRSKKDILRNAMVGVFLRLLEYHNGVLFLTTNRLSCLDEAFSSRISVAMHYHNLEYDARKTIWETFLTITTTPEIIATLDMEKLAAFNLNGRQIRSVVRLSCARSRIEKTDLSMDILLDTINISLDFKVQFSGEKLTRKVRKSERKKQSIHVELVDNHHNEDD